MATKKSWHIPRDTMLVMLVKVELRAATEALGRDR
jgi:hypothetical protein